MQEGAYAQLLSVLAVVLEHPVLASDQLLLCSAARVCSSWRAAVAASDSLTKLYVSIDEDSEASTYNEVQAVLQRLQHLRALKLEVDSEHSDDTENLDVSCISELCCLTQLELSIDLDEDEWGVLGQALLHLTGLQELALKCVDWHNTREPMSLQLAPLTALQNVSITVVSEMLGHDLWQLPRQLSSLQLDLGCLDMVHRSIQQKHCPVRSLGLGKLAHLRTLKVKMAAQHLLAFPGTVEALQQLTQVTTLALEYTILSTAHRDCSVWGRLPILLSLEINDSDSSDGWHPTKAKEALAGMAKATTLTKLDLSMGTQHSAPLEVCQHLAGLTKLRHLELCLEAGSVKERGCMHLSSLHTWKCCR